MFPPACWPILWSSKTAPDCAPGAVPPIGMAWGIPTIVDEELESNDEVYMEGGDHKHLLRLSHGQFHALMRAQPHGSFSRSPMH